MNEKIREAFHQVKAEEELKKRTKKFIYDKTKGYNKKHMYHIYYVLIPAACMLFIFIGYQIYFTPTLAISIDINPSIEMEVNRFDKVIAIEGYNEDGEELVNLLQDVKYMNYADAINQIIDNKEILALLSNDEIMVISVISQDNEQSMRILSNIESYTSDDTNIHCYHGDYERLDEANKLGLSYGKYDAYQKLCSLDINISIEEIQSMSMREIHDLLETYLEDDSSRHHQHGHGH